MNYYYDLNLNFQENNYYFYEWLDEDDIINIKKIPILRVSHYLFSKIYSSNFILDKNILEKIENKTFVDNTNIKYAALFSDTNQVIAIIFDEKGLSVKRSSLLFSEEINILELMYTLKPQDLEITCVNKIKSSYEYRIYNKIKALLQNELKIIEETKNNSKLKYLYKEKTGKTENNFELMIKELNDCFTKEITKNDINLYKIVIDSYKNV